MFLSDRILNSYLVQRMDGLGTYIIRRIFEAFTTNPQQLPDRTICYVMQAYINDQPNTEIDSQQIGTWRRELTRLNRTDSEFQQVLLRVICDHIAGMTDDYAISEYQELYGSNPFKHLNAVL